MVSPHHNKNRDDAFAHNEPQDSLYEVLLFLAVQKFRLN